MLPPPPSPPPVQLLATPSVPPPHCIVKRRRMRWLSWLRTQAGRAAWPSWARPGLGSGPELFWPGSASLQIATKVVKSLLFTVFCTIIAMPLERRKIPGLARLRLARLV